ncbi:GumC family protein [Alteromonas facilis]|uniref:GumC family protein n=1 Tax=Alteromonas facilis TaxID=2048004 RepID=UPI000C28E78B|nr:hypothetical protein [Alteromonas facilis]
MRYPLVVPTRWDQFRSWVYRILKWPYFVTGLVSYLFIGALVTLYLMKPPTFKSEMDLVLPGTGSSSNVSLDEVGQVVSQTTTPFGAGGFNPRVNYKEMLTSRGVLERAAETLQIAPHEFGTPKVRLTEQTSIISLSLQGNSPEQATSKAWALYESLQAELDNLRADEVARRDASIKNVLQGYREKTNQARANIVEFQQRALLVSTEQMEQAISTLSQVKAKKLDATANLSELEDYIQQLSFTLQVTPKIAGKALAMKSDPEFIGFYRELSDSSGVLSDYSSKWGNNHPKVVAAQKRVSIARASLVERGMLLTGVDALNEFMALNLENNPKRAELFADLINASAKKEGMDALIEDLNIAVSVLQEELKLYSREVAELDRLEREFDMAEAIYTSAAARLEANKSDVFASYPVVQLLTTPSNPIKQISPNPVIALVAGFAGLFFITFGLIVTWQRSNIVNLLLKRN